MTELMLGTNWRKNPLQPATHPSTLQGSPVSWHSWRAKSRLRIWILFFFSLIEIWHLCAEDIMIEYGRVLRKRRGGLCRLQRTLNHRALGKAWGLGQRRTQRPGIWRQEKAGLSTSLWLLRCPGPPCTPGCWAPTSSSRCPCSLPRPRRRSSLCPQIHTHTQKTRPSCQAANALLQTECCFKDAFAAKKSNKCNLLGRKGEEFASARRSLWTRGLLEQIRWTTPFTWCLHIPVSKVSLRGSLQIRLAKIVGTYPREWSWLLQVGYGPPREVPEVSGSSLIMAHYGL